MSEEELLLGLKNSSERIGMLIMKDAVLGWIELSPMPFEQMMSLLASMNACYEIHKASKK